MKDERVRWCRQRRGQDVKVTEAYPSATGGSRGRAGRRDRYTPAEDAEPRAINCYQCGQHIEDYAAISNCPFCDSDNFLGLNL